MLAKEQKLELCQELPMSVNIVLSDFLYNTRRL